MNMTIISPLKHIKNNAYALGILAGIVVFTAALAAVLIFRPRSGNGNAGTLRPGGDSSRAAAGSSGGLRNDGSIPIYDYTEAPDHIGEKATVKGTVVNVFTSKSGVTFLDYCRSSSDCPFSAVIFSGDLEKFGDVSQYKRELSLTGVIRSYQGTAEMALDDPSQIE